MSGKETGKGDHLSTMPHARKRSYQQKRLKRLIHQSLASASSRHYRGKRKRGAARSRKRRGQRGGILPIIPLIAAAAGGGLLSKIL